MVATFLDDNKPKTSVASFIDLIQFNLICQMLAKFSWVESERTVSKFRKRKRTFFVFVLCSCTPYRGRMRLTSFMLQSCNDG